MSDPRTVKTFDQAEYQAAAEMAQVTITEVLTQLTVRLCAHYGVDGVDGSPLFQGALAAVLDFGLEGQDVDSLRSEAVRCIDNIVPQLEIDRQAARLGAVVEGGRA